MVAPGAHRGLRRTPFARPPRLVLGTTGASAMATDVSNTDFLVLNVGGSGLAVGAVPQATCRACDLAPVVLDKKLSILAECSRIDAPNPRPFSLQISPEGLQLVLVPVRQLLTGYSCGTSWGNPGAHLL
jgi:hypothetical protein